MMDRTMVNQEDNSGNEGSQNDDSLAGISIGEARKKKDKKPPTTGASKAGLIFSTSRVHKHLKDATLNGMTIQKSASVYLAGVAEYLCAEILDAAGSSAKDNKRARVNPRDVMFAFRQDRDFVQFVGSSDQVVFSSAGIVPNTIRIEKVPEVMLKLEVDARKAKEKAAARKTLGGKPRVTTAVAPARKSDPAPNTRKRPSLSAPEGGAAHQPTKKAPLRLVSSSDAESEELSPRLNRTIMPSESRTSGRSGSHEDMDGERTDSDREEPDENRPRPSRVARRSIAPLGQNRVSSNRQVSAKASRDGSFHGRSHGRRTTIGLPKTKLSPLQEGSDSDDENVAVNQGSSQPI